MPLPNHKVIPDNWSAHHRPTAEGQMTATGTITIPASAADATFDEAAGRTLPAASSTVYTGSMRVQRFTVTQPTDIEAAARQVALRRYRVSIPVGAAEVPVGAVVTITACPDNPSLTGRPLHVVDIIAGTLIWQRDLICDDPAPQQR